MKTFIFPTIQYYLLKNSLAVKKGVALFKMASVKKVVKHRWWPRNGCDGRSVTKHQLREFVLPYPSFTRNQHKIHLIVIIKIFVTDLPSQPFLDCHLYFTTFFTLAILHI